MIDFSTPYTGESSDVSERLWAKDVLQESPRPSLRLNPQGNAEHRKLIEALSPRLGFDRREVQDEIAAELALFPTICKKNLRFAIVSEPNASGTKRISGFNAGRCLAEVPPECDFDASEAGGADLNLSSLKKFLGACQTAVSSAITRGKHLHDEFYFTSIDFKDLKEPIAAKEYFRGLVSTISSGTSQELTDDVKQRIAVARQQAWAYSSELWRRTSHQSFNRREHAPEADYLRACLAWSVSERWPKVMGIDPLESNRDYPYSCLRHGGSKALAAYIRQTGEGRETAKQIFLEIAQSMFSDGALIARARWNYSLLLLEELSDLPPLSPGPETRCEPEGKWTEAMRKRWSEYDYKAKESFQEAAALDPASFPSTLIVSTDSACTITYQQGGGGNSIRLDSVILREGEQRAITAAAGKAWIRCETPAGDEKFADLDQPGLVTGQTTRVNFQMKEHATQLAALRRRVQDFSVMPENVLRDSKTGQYWTRRDSAGLMSLSEAKAYCSGMSGGSWRLPSAVELKGITNTSDEVLFHPLSDHGRFRPRLEADVFGRGPNCGALNSVFRTCLVIPKFHLEHGHESYWTNDMSTRSDDCQFPERIPSSPVRFQFSHYKNGTTTSAYEKDIEIVDAADPYAVLCVKDGP